MSLWAATIDETIYPGDRTAIRVYTLMDGVTTNTSSSALEVRGYYHHTITVDGSGTYVLTPSVSVDGTNYVNLNPRTADGADHYSGDWKFLKVTTSSTAAATVTVQYEGRNR